MQTKDARQITSAGTGLRVIGSLTANVTDNIFHVNTLLFGNVGKDVMLIASDNIKPDIRQAGRPDRSHLQRRVFP